MTTRSKDAEHAERRSTPRGRHFAAPMHESLSVSIRTRRASPEPEAEKRGW
jgi:hypothetical protein